MKPFRVLWMVKGEGGGSSGGGTGFAATMDVLSEAFKFNVGSSEQCTATFSLNSDGTATTEAYGTPGYWYDPVTAGIGTSYWAIVTITSGAVTTGTVGSRVQLTSGATWTVTTSGSNIFRRQFAIGTIEIYDASSGGTLMTSGTFEISAEVDNT